MSRLSPRTSIDPERYDFILTHVESGQAEDPILGIRLIDETEAEGFEWHASRYPRRQRVTRRGRAPRLPERAGVGRYSDGGQADS
jgi:hypothetical protein